MFSSLTCVIHGDDSDQVQKSEAGHHEDLPKYLRRNGYFPWVGYYNNYVVLMTSKLCSYGIKSVFSRGRDNVLVR